MTLFNRVNIACVEKFHEESIYDKIQWAEIRFFQGAHLYMLAWQHIEKKKTVSWDQIFSGGTPLYAGMTAYRKKENKRTTKAEVQQYRKKENKQTTKAEVQQTAAITST